MICRARTTARSPTKKKHESEEVQAIACDGYPNKNVRPNQADINMTRGYMRAYAIMYAAEAQLTGECKMQCLKDTILKDCELWINSSAIISCSAIGAVLAIELRKDNCDIQTTASYNIFLFSMIISSVLGMTCMVDRISYASFYNMVPASFICEARSHTSEVIIGKSKEWSTAYVLRMFYLDDRSLMFFVSTVFLFIGMFSAIYNQYGFNTGTIVCLGCCSLCLVHMKKTCLAFTAEEYPKFAKTYCDDEKYGLLVQVGANRLE